MAVSLESLEQRLEDLEQQLARLLELLQSGERVPNAAGPAGRTLWDSAGSLPQLGEVTDADLAAMRAHFAHRDWPAAAR